MEQRDEVYKLLSIFDLNIFKALDLEENISTRVMFSYDKESNKSEFKVLKQGMSQEMRRRIEGWLEENINDFKYIANLNAGKMDADRLVVPLAR